MKALGRKKFSEALKKLSKSKNPHALVEECELYIKQSKELGLKEALDLQGERLIKLLSPKERKR